MGNGANSCTNIDENQIYRSCTTININVNTCSMYLCEFEIIARTPKVPLMILHGQKYNTAYKHVIYFQMYAIFSHIWYLFQDC